ncbi:MAG: DUF4366 domain-containing protein [Eubacterium sp.]|nr:DUF4366 domain-containing protein [Eubacterium sp.]
MSEKFEDLVSAVKANELVRKIRRKEEEKKGHPVIVCLAIVGAVVAVAAIAYAVYRYMNPKYADFDADFDYDDFEDDFDDFDDDDTADGGDAFESSGK